MRPAKVGVWAFYGVQSSSTIFFQDLRYLFSSFTRAYYISILLLGLIVKVGFRAFADRFVNMCRTRGMVINRPDDMCILTADKLDLDERMKAAAKHRCEFVLFAQQDSCFMHGKVIFLLLFGVVSK